MVYVPYKLLKAMMLEKDADVTEKEVHTNWLRLLNWVPSHKQELEAFKQQFPGHRNEIICHVVSQADMSVRIRPKNTRRHHIITEDF